MVDATAVLRQGGIVADPADVIAAARAAGLPLAVQAAKLMKESYGGKNVFGHDNVPTGGTYEKGGQVTRDNCQAYLRWRRGGKGRQQGVGPSQLTYYAFQDQAEELGGLHVPEVNMRVGAIEMARCIRAGGSLRDAGALYNGGRKYAQASTAAQAYGRDLETRAADWDRRLSGAVVPTGGGGSGGSGAGRPELHEGDTSELVWKLQVFMNRVFPAYSRINAGDKPPSRLGPQTVGVLTEFQRRSGIPTAPPFAVGPKTWAALEKAGFRG